MVSKLEKVQGAMVGLALGDALGMPYEIMTSKAIIKLTGGVGVTGFDSPHPPKGRRKIPDMNEAEFGQTTDDTQLSLVVAQSLIAQRKFDLEDLAIRHYKAEEASTFGWGKTTQVGARELGEYFRSSGRKGRRWDIPADNPDTKGTGNGVAMKVAPLALFQALRDTHYLYRNHEVMQLGFLTHRDSRASHAAAALAEVIRHTFKYESYLTYPFTRPRDNGEGFLVDIADVIEGLEHSYPSFEMGPRVSKQIRKMLDTNVFYDPVRLREEIGTSCYAVESVPYAIGVAGRNYHDFKAGVLEAINSGGDTDTNASMVGAIIGANVGIQGIPMEWIGFNPEFTKIAQVAEQLYKVGSKK